MKFKILACTFYLLSIVLTKAFQRELPHIDTTFVKPRRPMKCYPDFQDRKIGVSYGMRYQMPGIEIKTRAWGFRVLPTANIEWRWGKNNNRYFDSKLTKHFLFNYGNLEFPITAGYKKILYHNNNKIEQLYFGAGIFKWDNGVLVGYVRGSNSSPDFRRSGNNGALIQFYNELFYSLSITTTMIYWFDEFQYSLKFTDGIYDNRIYVGVTLEKIEDWNEMNLSLLFLL